MDSLVEFLIDKEAFSSCYNILQIVGLLVIYKSIINQSNIYIYIYIYIYKYE